MTATIDFSLKIYRNFVRWALPAIGVNNQAKTTSKLGLSPTLDPPKSLLKRGVGVDFECFQSPPY